MLVVLALGVYFEGWPFSSVPESNKKKSKKKSGLESASAKDDNQENTLQEELDKDGKIPYPFPPDTRPKKCKAKKYIFHGIDIIRNVQSPKLV